MSTRTVGVITWKTCHDYHCWRWQFILFALISFSSLHHEILYVFQIKLIKLLYGVYILYQTIFTPKYLENKSMYTIQLLLNINRLFCDFKLIYIFRYKGSWILFNVKNLLNSLFDLNLRLSLGILNLHMFAWY